MDKNLLVERCLVLQPGAHYIRVQRANSCRPKTHPNFLARKVPHISPTSNILYESTCNNSLQYFFEKNDTVSCTEFASSAGIAEVNGSDIYPDTLYGKNALDYSQKMSNFKLFNFYNYSKFTLNHSRAAVSANFEELLNSILNQELDISARNVSHFSVILLIDSSFVRKDVRDVVDILLNKIGFAHVLVQLSSATVTYVLRMPSCMVIDIGASKISITCVEEGVAILETSVTIPVGFYDVLILLKSRLKEAFEKNSSQITNITELYDLLNLLNVLNNEFFLRNSCEAFDKAQDFIEIEQFESDDGQQILQGLRVSKNALKKLNLLPFMFTKMFNPSFSPCSVLNSEPDDPFDDLYLHLTNPGRKPPFKKVLKPEDDQASDHPQESKKEESITPKIQDQSTATTIVQHPDYFENIAEAVWWSINELGAMTTNHLKTNCPTSAGDSLNQQVEHDLFAIVTGEECRRRMLQNIVLIGGGASHSGVKWIENWLSKELKRIAASSSIEWISGGPSIEVRSFTNPETAHNLAWIGGTLMAHTSCLSDSSITAAHWNKHGTKTIRERALFRW